MENLISRGGILIKITSFHSPLVIGLLILSTALHLPIASGQPSNLDDCYYYAYTVDSTSTHYSLVKNNSYLIGQNLLVESNCEYTLILNDNYFIQDSGNSFHQISIDTRSISFTTSNNQTISFNNITVFPSDSFDFQDFNYNEEYTVSSSKLWTSELLAHGITAFILYSLSTSVVYRIAKNKVDNSIEVVI